MPRPRAAGRSAGDSRVAPGLRRGLRGLPEGAPEEARRPALPGAAGAHALPGGGHACGPRPRAAAERRHCGGAEPVHARIADRSRQRGGGAGGADHPAPGPDAGRLRRAAGNHRERRQSERDRRHLPAAGTEARLRRPDHAAHGGGQQEHLSGDRQAGRTQRHLRSRIRLQAHPGGPDQRQPLRRAAHRGHGFGHLLQGGDRGHDLCRQPTATKSTPIWTIWRCRPST